MHDLHSVGIKLVEVIVWFTSYSANKRSETEVGEDGRRRHKDMSGGVHQNDALTVENNNSRIAYIERDRSPPDGRPSYPKSAENSRGDAAAQEKRELERVKTVLRITQIERKEQFLTQ